MALLITDGEIYHDFPCFNSFVGRKEEKKCFKKLPVRMVILHLLRKWQYLVYALPVSVAFSIVIRQPFEDNGAKAQLGWVLGGQYPNHG